MGDDEVGTLAAAFNDMLGRLEHAQEALVRSEKLGLAGLLAARVAHDVRNPLSSLKMQAQLLRSRVPGAEGQTMLRAVLHDVEQVESVVRGLLELAKPGEVTLQPTQLNDVVAQVLDHLALQLNHRKVILDADLELRCRRFARRTALQAGAAERHLECQRSDAERRHPLGVDPHRRGWVVGRPPGVRQRDRRRPRAAGTGIQSVRVLQARGRRARARQYEIDRGEPRRLGASCAAQSQRHVRHDLAATRIDGRDTSSGGVMADILVVDDEESIAAAFQQFLSDEGHDYRIAGSADEGVRLIAERQPNIVFMDVRMPGRDGVQTLHEVRTRFPEAYVVMMTAYGTSQTSIDAIRAGAFDYLTKPLDLDQIRAVIAKALAAQRVRDSSGAVRGEGAEVEHAGVRLIGESPGIQEVYKMIGRLAINDVPVLILGERGIGKQLVARTIHENSNRSSGPFRILDCESMPDSELDAALLSGEGGGACTWPRSNRCRRSCSRGWRRR